MTQGRRLEKPLLIALNCTARYLHGFSEYLLSYILPNYQWDIFICRAVYWTQGLMHARQVLYQLALSPFFQNIFRSLNLFPNKNHCTTPSSSIFVLLEPPLFQCMGCLWLQFQWSMISLKSVSSFCLSSIFSVTSWIAWCGGTGRNKIELVHDSSCLPYVSPVL
jgi:hypothetical protein